MERNRFVHYGSVLLAIAAISAGSLAGVNGLTKGVIAQNNTNAQNAARKEVLPLAAKFEDTKVLKSKDGNYEFLPGYNEAGEKVGYVVVLKDNGYGGVITSSLGLDMDGKITGLKVMNHQETPGLGAKITNPDWQKIWIGRDANHTFNKSVDAFAGATISPEAVYNGVKKALNAYGEVK